MTDEAGDPPHPATSTPRRVLHLSLATVYIVLAGAGAVLPLLPTTPFVLLTSYHLSRASPRLDRALRESRLFGPVLRDWHDRGGVRPWVKWVATTVVVACVAGFLLLREGGGYAGIALVALAAIGLVVVWRLPVATGDGTKDPRRG